jgi:hypothetical protein
VDQPRVRIDPRGPPDDDGHVRVQQRGQRHRGGFPRPGGDLVQPDPFDEVRPRIDHRDARAAG